MYVKKPFEGYEGLLQAVSQFGDNLIKSNIENMARLTDSIAKTIEPNHAVDEIVNRQKQMLASLNIPSHNQMLAIAAIENQWNVLSYLVSAYRTPEIVSLQKSLIQNDFGGLQVFADSLKSSTHIEAANIAVIKMAPIFEGISFHISILLSNCVLRLQTTKYDTFLNTTQQNSPNLLTNIAICFIVEIMDYIVR